MHVIALQNMYLDTVVTTSITQLAIASFSSLFIIYVLKNSFVRKAGFYAQLKIYNIIDLNYCIMSWEGKQMLARNSPQFCIYSESLSMNKLWKGYLYS